MMMDTARRSVRRIVVLTHLPSPYQVELFNEVQAQRPGVLHVYYLFRQDDSRTWGPVSITHSHAFLDEGRAGIDSARIDVARSPFVVFNYYNNARAADLIRARAETGRGWCFWGERPGYRYPTLSRIARLSRLDALRSSNQPIWGIGSWAVDAYRAEFGTARRYLNLPYFSDLARFQAGHSSFSGDVRFLFSGSLSHRKGIDLLARAFARLASEFPRSRLTIMGTGHLEAKTRATLAPCAGQVDWIGFKDWGELPAVYAAAHLLCVPSRHDGWGLVVPEGLAAGLPVIGTDRTGAALDLIEPRANGWLVPAGDEHALLASMREAASLRPDQWQAMSRRARASVAEHSLANGARRFLAAVDKAAAASVLPESAE